MVELPLWAVLGLTNLLLLAAGLLIFLPEGSAPPRPRDLRRFIDHYGRYVAAGLLVIGVHFLRVQLDDRLTAFLGWDFAPILDRFGGGLTALVPQWWLPSLVFIASLFYAVVHPFMLVFTPFLFVLSDEERAAKAALLAFPLGYGLALPFLLFFPATNAFTSHAITPPVAEAFPQLWARLSAFASVNDSFPSVVVAFAALMANATRYSRNVRFGYFAFAYAATVAAATVYLGTARVVDVAGGLVLAGFAATLTTRILSVERLALTRVKPEPEAAQAVQDSAESLVTTVEREAKALGYTDLKIMLVGSVAKDTYLAARVDFDVFVLFPPDVAREELEHRGLTLARVVLPDGEAAYAEHPYLAGSWQGFEADIVPAYAVSDPTQKMSAVDRTPFHTRFVLDRMSREQRDQTRLLKQFMVGVGVYGAEARTRGFSGYLCELLVLKHRSFRGVLRAGAKWKPGTFLSLQTHEGNPKFTDPVVFLDPVDPRRNVASAVSAQTLAAFTDACKAFLHRESLSFFFTRQLVPLSPEDLERTVRHRRGDFVLLTFRKPDVLEDHVHDQLRKAVGTLTRLLERHEFEVKRATTEVGRRNARILLELTRLRLPEGILHVGPPVKERDHAERFRKAWTSSPESLSEVYEEDGRLKVKRRREYRRAEDLLRAQLTTLHLGKHVSKTVKDGYRLESGLEVVHEESALVLTRHLDRRKAWEL